MRLHNHPYFVYTFLIQSRPQREKTCLGGFANNKGADQPAHACSLINAFVIRFSESSKPKLATNDISMFYIVSVAEQAGLRLTWSDTPKTGFVATRPNSDSCTCFIQHVHCNITITSR